jgi:hypothetical protein
VSRPTPPTRAAAIGTTMSATSGDMRFERMAPSSTAIVRSPSNGSMTLSPILFFESFERKFAVSITQLK